MSNLRRIRRLVEWERRIRDDIICLLPCNSQRATPWIDSVSLTSYECREVANTFKPPDWWFKGRTRICLYNIHIPPSIYYYTTDRRIYLLADPPNFHLDPRSILFSGVSSAFWINNRRLSAFAERAGETEQFGTGKKEEVWWPFVNSPSAERDPTLLHISCRTTPLVPFSRTERWRLSSVIRVTRRHRSS